MVQGSRLDKKVEKVVKFILKGGEWRKWRDTMTVARIFPWSTLRFAPGILLSVNWMKVRERFMVKLMVKGYDITDINKDWNEH